MTSMFIKIFFLVFFLHLKITISVKQEFLYNGFGTANLSLNGTASITSNGLLELTQRAVNKNGYAFYPIPLHFKSSASKTLSFSTTFVFSIVSQLSQVSGLGLTFFISPKTDFSSALPSQYFGLFNENNNGNSTNHIFAIELDTITNTDFHDIDGNHVGIDVNSLISINSHTAGYYDDTTGMFKNLSLISGQPMQVWVDFYGDEMQVNVTLSPIRMPKPSRPLLSSTLNLSSLMLDPMHIGFSSSSGPFNTYHCIQGWSFKMDGAAEPLSYALLPSLPTFIPKSSSNVLVIWLPIASSLFVLLFVVAIVLVMRRRMKYVELVEDWELEYGPHRFSYKDLFQATKGFREKELLGAGGFGRVYKGVLPSSKMEVAIKKVSNQSSQGMKGFVAEIVSMGHLSHRNLVQLLGYCRRKGELLLVYDFMPNGSLDRFLYDHNKPTLNWGQRFKIIKGVATGLLYLHEDWERVVIHRDIKASNVLLDSELNGRLGDFGLARLYSHGTDPQTTHVAGTIGYLAPELTRTGKATTATDVFAFGAFLLEVACGRRPVEQQEQEDKQLLIDWVLSSWQKELILETRDSRLGEEYNAFEVELVLKLGLLCSNPLPEARPSMQQVVHFLEGDATLSELPPSYNRLNTLLLFNTDGSEDQIESFFSSVADISLSGGR